MVEPSRQRQLADARELLAEVRDTLVRFGAAAEDQERLARSIRQLDEFFLIVVVGEFNAGKSAFINALLGTAVLKEGVTPTTADINLLRFGDSVTSALMEPGFRVITAPAELLRDLHIVDTPGTNAIVREHERLTTEFVPRADLVLFLTSAERPFTESERAFLHTIREWGKKIVLIVNKIDIFAHDVERQEVLAFVRESARTHLGVTPETYGVSARLAIQAKHGEPSLWQQSGFEPLERYVRETLDEGSRFRLKLENPLGVAQALAQRYAAVAQERLSLLNDDIAVLQGIASELDVYRADLARGFALRMTAVENVLVEMESRGHAFFDDTLRVGRVLDLFNRSRVQKEFEDRVVADAPRMVERRTAELIDWLVEMDFRQWQAVTARLSERRHDRGATMGAPEIGSFHSTRAHLITSLGGETQRVVAAYDRQREAAQIAEHARAAVTTAAAAGGAAVGLGTVVTLAASTAAADVTGILMASLVATLGFLVIPARRRRAKGEMKEKLSALRARLAQTLRTEFEQAQAGSLERIERAIDPYQRFVRTEEQRGREAASSLKRVLDRTAALRDRLAA